MPMQMPQAHGAIDKAEGCAIRATHLTDRLSVQSAIIHHLEWCVLFNDHLAVDAVQSQMLPALPCAEQSCLGLWLTALNEGPAKGDPRLVELNAEHTKFHAVAQNALALARQGRMDLASTLLNTDFERSRARILDLLRKIQKN